MTKRINLRRGATIGLALVSAFLLARLVLEATGWWGGLGSAAASPAAAAPPPASTGAAAPRSQAAPAAVVPEPMLRLELLKALDSRPLPDFERSPFDFAPTPEEIKAKQAAVQAPPPPPPTPPPPPPIPFKAMGFQQDLQGKRIVYLSDEDGTYVVREGEEFGQHFKVLKITDESVEVQDETYHQTAQLPYPAE